MGWEQRGNRRHYYTARRVGGRVVKEYVPDAVAPLAAQLAAEQRAERDAERAAIAQARAELDALADVVAPLDELAGLLHRAAMIAAGYHKHKGQWRKRRG
ncbi:hypothetical protein J0H58_19605 [bacterium]|nr:hypothetical protein [bacterium]